MAQPKIAKVRKPKAERIEQQIRTLIELGKSADEIAAFLHVTVYSLKAACSQLGLNLRETAEKDAAPLRTEEIGRTEAGRANLLLTIQCNDSEQASPLRLSNEAIAKLIIEAEVRASNLGQLLAMIITTATATGLSHVLDDEPLEEKQPEHNCDGLRKCEATSF